MYNVALFITNDLFVYFLNIPHKTCIYHIYPVKKCNNFQNKK